MIHDRRCTVNGSDCLAEEWKWLVKGPDVTSEVANGTHKAEKRVNLSSFLFPHRWYQLTLTSPSEILLGTSQLLSSLFSIWDLDKIVLPAWQMKPDEYLWVWGFWPQHQCDFSCFMVESRAGQQTGRVPFFELFPAVWTEKQCNYQVQGICGVAFFYVHITRHTFDTSSICIIFFKKASGSDFADSSLFSNVSCWLISRTTNVSLLLGPIFHSTSVSHGSANQHDEIDESTYTLCSSYTKVLIKITVLIRGMRYSACQN